MCNDCKDCNCSIEENYEVHVRGNENLRDQLDGRIKEPRLEKSMENSVEDNNRSEQSMG